MGDLVNQPKTTYGSKEGNLALSTLCHKESHNGNPPARAKNSRNSG